MPAPLLPVAPLVAAAALLAIMGRVLGVDRNSKVLGSVSTASILLSLLAVLHLGDLKASLNGYPPPLGTELSLSPLSRFFAIVILGIGAIVALYSIDYMEGEDRLDGYYALLLTLIAGMVGVTLSNDLLTLYMFWELMCVSSYTLVAFRRYHWEPVEASFKYLVLSSLGSLAALLGMAMLLEATGTLNMDAIREAIKAALASGAVKPNYVALAATLLVAGFGVTAAIAPFHTWLPDAHPAAPSSISAILSGVVIKVGAYAILRALFSAVGLCVEGLGLVVLAFGLATYTIANLMVYSQSDVKRFLAYSSIANMGIILTGSGFAYWAARHGFALAARLALAGAIFHVLNHALGKALLFLTSGTLIEMGGTRDITKLKGLLKLTPATCASAGIGLLSLAGIPPLSGFWSKYLIVAGVLAAPSAPVSLATAAIFIVNAMLAAGYYLWLLQRLALERPAASAEREPGFLMELSVSLLAAFIVLITVLLGQTLAPIEAAVDILLRGW